MGFSVYRQLWPPNHPLGFFAWVELAWSCVCCHNCCKVICATVLLFQKNTVSLIFSTIFGSYNLWTPLLRRFLSLIERDVSFMSNKGLRTSLSLSLCTLTSQGSLQSTARSFFDESWERLTYGYENKSLGVILILSIQQNSSIGSSPRIYLVTDSWSFSEPGMSFISWSGPQTQPEKLWFLYNPCTTIAPVGTFSQAGCKKNFTGNPVIAQT